jgi:tRNA pseudouridine38-40 synthase
VPRWRLLIEYDGSGFVGWQRQAGGPSVQAALEAAAEAFTGTAVEITGAGRTDAGVHAAGQVAHLDLARDWAPERLVGAFNAHLRPQPVAVLAARSTSGDFHARFSAVGRRYLYRILDRRAPPALDRGRVWHVPVALDSELMHEAAQALIGRHDLTSFRAADCQAASPVKTIDRLHVARSGDEIHVRAAARSFLHHQVRIIVGTLRLVGERSRPVAWVAEARAARDRTAAGPTAPPEGLCLEAVIYPPSL